MSAIGAKTLLVAAGAVSLGIGAGFERSLQESWKTSALPRVISAAAPVRMFHANPDATARPTSVPVQERTGRQGAPPVALAVAPPASAPHKKHAPVKTALVQPRNSSQTIDVAQTAIVEATAGPIIAKGDEKPTDVAPVEDAVAGAPIDAESVQAPATPAPAPTPTPTPTPPPKKPWLHRQFQHLNPFKAKSTPTPQ